MVMFKYENFIFANTYFKPILATDVSMHISICKFGPLLFGYNRTDECEGKINGRKIFSMRYVSEGTSHLDVCSSMILIADPCVFGKLYKDCIVNSNIPSYIMDPDPVVRHIKLYGFFFVLSLSKIQTVLLKPLAYIEL